VCCPRRTFTIDRGGPVVPTMGDVGRVSLTIKRRCPRRDSYEVGQQQRTRWWQRALVTSRKRAPGFLVSAASWGAGRRQVESDTSLWELIMDVPHPRVTTF